MTGVAAPAAAGWLASLEQLFAIPPEYRRADAPRAHALEMLRCSEETLDALVAAGLPCEGSPGDERFDANDLFNLALYSSSRASVPERAFQFVLRWMTDPCDAWFEPRRWSFSLELTPDGDGATGGTSRLLLARPRPELLGGRMLDLETEPAQAAAEEGDIVADGVDRLTVRGRIETAGARMTLRSPRLRDIVEEFESTPYRWLKLPEELQRQPERLLPHGVATCIAASLHLERRCREAGLRARTRRGWVLGMLDLAHAWLEVEDDDGVVKTVDPIFALLSGLVDDPNPEFRTACRGSRLNRLLATDHRADEPLELHLLDGRAAPVRRKTVVRRDRSPT